MIGGLFLKKMISFMKIKSAECVLLAQTFMTDRCVFREGTGAANRLGLTVFCHDEVLPALTSY
jgi:hypothetical protein